MALVKKFFFVSRRQGLVAALKKTILFLRWKKTKRYIGTKIVSISQDDDQVNPILELIYSTPASGREEPVQSFHQNLKPVIHLVENFDRGGLEQFVLDLTWGHVIKGQRAVIGFTHSGGSMQKEAVDRGLEVRDFSDFQTLRDFIKFENVTTCFIHHSYRWLVPELFELVDVIEVLHNPYWWQVGNSELVYFRKQLKNVVCVSKYVAKFATERLQVDPDSLVIIPNCIPNIDFINDKPKDGKIFLSVSNFAEQKNHLLLIKGFILFCSEEDNYEFELWLVGKDIGKHLSEKIEELLADNRKVRVKIFHVANHEDMRMIYEEASYFILPSTFEGFSLASLEAISYGLPSALSKCGGFYEIAEVVNNLVPITGVTPQNRLLNYDYINSTCWDPSDEQIRSTASSFKALLTIGALEVDVRRYFRHEQMVDRYQSLVTSK